MATISNLHKQKLNKQELHKKAQLALTDQNYQLAHEYVLAILQQDKFFADGYFLLGIIASVHHNLTKALQLIEQAHKLESNNQEYLAYLAKHYALLNKPVLAQQALKKIAIDKVGDNPLVLDTIGVTYSQIGLHQEAINFYQKAVELSCDNAYFYFNYGASLKFIGEFAKAKQAYQRSIELKPNFFKAYYGLISVGSAKENLQHINKLDKIFTSLSKPDDKLQIGHAIAKIYEQNKQYDQSFQALLAAKEEKRASITYSINDDKALFDAIFSHFQNNKASDNGFDNDEAIFIVGMPRTGTTLVERILSNHSEVTSAGELQNFGLLFKQLSKCHSNKVIDADIINNSNSIDYTELGKKYIESTRHISGKTAKFVDKMPFNIFYVGFILQALPKAKIICLDRQPLDTIFSNFKQLFSVNQSYYNYAYSLDWTTEFYLMFKQLMAFWQQEFPDNFYCVNYEKLVNEPEEEAKKLINFSGLSWQENCLDISNNQAAVATASAVQVRKGINNNSINFWQNYSQHLDKIKDKLA